MNNISKILIAGLGGIIAFASTAYSQELTLESLKQENAFVFNTLLFLIGGFLVMFMAAGFAMLEAGLVRSKNVSMQCLKNISLYSIAGIMYWCLGYSLMYSGVDGGFMGAFMPYAWPAAGEVNAGDYSVGSDWFFQMVFCATTASIVSGTLAERIKFWPFIIFTIFLTGILYPIAGSWKWGAGWLASGADVSWIKSVAGAEFQDFAGSTLVHSVGGWAALTGAIILGARHGRFGKNGQVVPMPGSNIPLATLGTFILWLGWFGFNGGSQLVLGDNANASDISRIFINTNLAAAGGVVTVIVLLQIIYKKIDVTMALNGALAGLVAITAEPLMPSPLAAILIGGVGGAIVVLVVPMLDRFKIDDVVGAIPVHLVAGIWGTMAVPITNGGATYLAQLIGVGAYAAFAIVASAVVWFALKMTMGIRVSEEEEYLGLDKSEIGVEAYPEFASGRV